MQQQKPFLAGILLLLTGLAACDSTEIGDSKDVNQDKIYMDYHISCNEAEQNVSLNLKYRFAGSMGTTLVLNEPSHVELDGKKLSVDSSEFAGAFYEAEKRADGFAGKHTIGFTDNKGKKLENNFNFKLPVLNSLPASADRNKDLVISLNSANLNPSDNIEINSLNTDSSFHYQQTGSSITIAAKDIQRQKGKTLTLQCQVYRNVPLQQTTSEGGSLKIAYRLKPVKIKLQP